jgi:hypothetical protein
LHSHVGRTLSHLLALSGTISTFCRSKHGDDPHLEPGFTLAVKGTAVGSVLDKVALAISIPGTEAAGDPAFPVVHALWTVPGVP